MFNSQQKQMFRENFIIAVVWAVFLAPLLFLLFLGVNWLLVFINVTDWHTLGFAQIIFFPAAFIFPDLFTLFLSNPFYSGFFLDFSGSVALDIAFMFALLSAIRFWFV